MNADQAYMAAFLITGSHIDAELARTRQRAKLAVCPICGDNIEAGDTVWEYQGRNAHSQCVERVADRIQDYDTLRKLADLVDYVE